MVFDVHSLRYACKDSDDPLKYIQTAVPYNLCFKLVKSDSRLVKSILFSYGFVQVIILIAFITFKYPFSALQRI
jgi:hypothetical protein